MLDEPRRAGVVQKGRIAAPAEGIIVRRTAARSNSSPRSFRSVQHQRVRVLDEHARPLACPPSCSPAVSTKLHERHVVFAADPVVVLAERRGDVYDAGTVGHGDVVVADDERTLCLSSLPTAKSNSGSYSMPFSAVPGISASVPHTSLLAETRSPPAPSP